jgi:hypothetical protein
MRPVVLKLASSRWPLPLITLGLALFLRAADPGRIAWRASDMQSIAGAILYGALIPVLVIALASSWLRGDDGPWAWALARPVTRARWMRTTLLIDVVTVLACIGLARVVIGPMPNHWIQTWMQEFGRTSGYAALIVAVYAAAAFGGARGNSAIGGALCVVAFAAFAMVLNACAAVSEVIIRETLRAGGFYSTYSVYAFYWWGAAAMRSFGTLSSLTSMTIIAGIAIIAIRRTARELPQRPRLASLTGLATIAIALAITAPWVLSAVVLWWIA